MNIAVADRRPVLVVDDDAAIREVVQIIVEAEGYPVVTAAEGAEALRHLQSGLRPGVILLDLRMPGMDGRAFREVQGAEPELAEIARRDPVGRQRRLLASRAASGPSGS